MKQIISSILLLFLLQERSHAQMMVNGDFAINSGNTQYDCQWNGTTQSVGPSINKVQNWMTSFGTPWFTMLGTTAQFPSTIMMTSAEETGEGITGYYPFKAGRTYHIYIGFSSLPHPENFEIWLTQNPETNLGQCYSICSSANTISGQAPNLWAAGGNRVWGKGSNALVPCNIDSPLKVGNNMFTYTPTQDWNWIQLYSWHTGCYDDDLYLNYVWIFPDCINDLYLNAAPDNYYAGYSNIWIGSQYGSGIPLTTIDGSKRFEAGQQITINTSTLITAKKGASTLYIDPATCGRYPGHIYYSDPGCGGSHRSSLAVGDNKFYGSEITKTLTDDNVEVYPNPAKDNLSLKIGKAETSKIDITLLDMVGRVQMKTSVVKENEGSQEFKLNVGDLPTGNYYLVLVAGSERFTRKITIIK
ncbi:T9SS type A sorting domain-containing protein [Chitinophagaceae bacterium MMS25-I14]